MDSLEGYVSYDHLAMDALRRLGWQVEEVSWRKKDTDWNRYNIVLIRTPWDYQQDPETFLKVLETIDHSSARLENSLDLVRWNLNKRYLKELEEKGTLIVPTLWEQTFSAENFRHWSEKFSGKEIIVKPLVSANADYTYRLPTDTTDERLAELVPIFVKRPFMVQPFMPSVIHEGEFSVFFFGERYSHTILKKPKSADFRVQEEHGGIIRAVEPEQHLQETAKKVLRLISPQPLYSRIDLVRTEKNQFALMEVELIEPSLYFSYSEPSAALFASTVQEWVQKG
ncbi:MAG: RimK family alpha-L-glutamate ligase [Cyclobacteriaceae bacterium]